MPASARYLPPKQSVQAVPESPKEYFPPAHTVHWSMVVNPVPVPYEPAGHIVQTLAPSALLYNPTEQGMQSEDWSCFVASAASLMYFPAGQFVQVILAATAVSLYLPATQMAQFTLSEVYLPTAQKRHDAEDPDWAAL